MLNKILFATIIFFAIFSPTFAEVYVNYGQIRAEYPNGIKPLIPYGMSGRAWESEYKKGTDEYMVDYCRWLHPQPCDALD